MHLRFPFGSIRPRVHEMQREELRREVRRALTCITLCISALLLDRDSDETLGFRSAVPTSHGLDRRSCEWQSLKCAELRLQLRYCLIESPEFDMVTLHPIRDHCRHAEDFAGQSRVARIPVDRAAGSSRLWQSDLSG